MESNEMLKEKVENGIDEKLFPNYIDIQVLENEVTLKGIVKNHDEKANIEKITRNTFGVMFVNNELAIN